MQKLDPVVQEIIDKTLKEMGLDKNFKPFGFVQGKPLSKQDSRNWQDPRGYQYLAVWQNSALLRVLVRKFTETLPLFPAPTLNQTLNSPLSTLKGKIRVKFKGNLRVRVKSEHRLIAQMDDEARSIIRNIEEGFKRASTKEYLTFLGYSQASLEELRGDIGDCKIFGYLPSQPLSSLKGIGIDLRVYKGPSGNKGEVYGDPASDPRHPYYKPLITLNPKTLSYEIFLELINKTDYLLRQLVVSLEKKLNNDKKYYQVDQIRLNRRARGE